MTDEVRDRVLDYLEGNPDADRWEVLAALNIDPAHAEVVDELLERAPEPAGSEDAASDDSISVHEECTLPHCHEPRVNPHPHSLCEDHHAGEPSASDEQRELSETDGEQEPTDIVGDRNTSDDAGAGESPETAADERGGLSAADFMGGDSDYAAPDNETRDALSDGPRATDTSYAAPVSTLPLQQLDRMSPDERRRAAKQRGLDWPTTERAREQLFDTIADVLRHGDDRVVDAPTSLGKSYTIAGTRWDAREDLTGGKPVVHLSKTRDARDEAVETADADGGQYFVLQSRDEACPVAAGGYDPPADDAVEVDYTPITIEGQPASEYIADLCEGRGLPFSAVHRHLEEENDQGVELPCCRGSSTTYDEEAGDFDDGEPSECPAIHQYERLREGDYPLVIATHNFAHVPGLRTHTNVVIDEQPDFAADLSTSRVRDAVGAYLRAVDAPVTTWEQFITTAGYEGWGDDAAAERGALEDALQREPDREWYFQEPKAHTLAPALARAIFHAEERANGRRVGKTPYEPPRLDASARDDDSWNQEWVTVVLDKANDVRTVRAVPDLSLARSVAGLDAHPAVPVWQANTLPYIERAEVLEPEARQLWRRYERGLRVVQVGDATRPLASGEYFDDRGARALVEHLQETYGADFQTAITASSVENRLERIMRNAGIATPELMHYGEEKSRNDFAAEPIGLVNGCIDPGDDYVVDLLAELDLDAEPERSETVCASCEGEGCRDCDGVGYQRAHGRGFVGADAETAAEILAAVRENHTAQAAGRYARNPDDSSSTATVFVRTDAMPVGFADVHVPGVTWRFTAKQERVIEALRDAPGRLSARDLAHAADVSKRHVQRTLERLIEEDVVDAVERIGPNGATMYAETGSPNSGVVDLTDADGEVTTAPVWDSYTWAVAIADPSVPAARDEVVSTPADDDRPTIWPAGTGGDTGDPGG